MTKVVFSLEAKRDLKEIGDYIAFQLHNRSAARTLLGRIQTTVQTLRQFPESGTLLDYAGPEIPYRYLVCGNYLIFYRASNDQAYVERILYGRRDYLAILFGDQINEETE